MISHHFEKYLVIRLDPSAKTEAKLITLHIALKISKENVLIQLHNVHKI